MIEDRSYEKIHPIPEWTVFSTVPSLLLALQVRLTSSSDSGIVRVATVLFIE